MCCRRAKEAWLTSHMYHTKDRSGVHGSAGCLSWVQAPGTLCCKAEIKTNNSGCGLAFCTPSEDPFWGIQLSLMDVKCCLCSVDFFFQGGIWQHLRVLLLSETVFPSSLWVWQTSWRHFSSTDTTCSWWLSSGRLRCPLQRCVDLGHSLSLTRSPVRGPPCRRCRPGSRSCLRGCSWASLGAEGFGFFVWEELWAGLGAPRGQRGLRSRPRLFGGPRAPNRWVL